MGEEKAYRWIPRDRDYDEEHTQRSVRLVSTRRDPLLTSSRLKSRKADSDNEDSDFEDHGRFDENIENSNHGNNDGNGNDQGGVSSTVAISEETGAPADDPLSMAAAEATSGESVDLGADPLGGGSDSAGAAGLLNTSSGLPSALAADTFAPSADGSDANNNGTVNPFKDGTFEPWEARKSGILQTYTTNMLISVVTGGSGDDDNANGGGDAATSSSSGAAASSSTSSSSSSSSSSSGAGQPPTTAGSDAKTQSRLAQLDDTAEGTERKVLQMSQKEYTEHIRQLNEELKVSWAADEKVKAIKIAIQAAKFLADPSVPQFYPSMYVLVTEVLDTFGKLVFGRILTIANDLSEVRLPESFSADMVPNEARETCRNWFYKIASIRELIPRILVELSMLKSYRFIAEKGDFAVILARIVAMVRGIGDPLVAAYVRAYIARVGVEVSPGSTRDYLVSNFSDILLTFKPQLTGKALRRTISKCGMSEDKLGYFNLYAPALDWTLQCAGHRAPKEVFFAVVARYVKHCGSAIVLHSILSSFPAALVSTYAGKMIELVKAADYASYPKHKVYGALSASLVAHAPPKKDRLGLLSDIWKAVRKLDDVADFVAVAGVFIDFPLRYFSPREVNTILGDVYKKVHYDRRYEPLLPQLHTLLHRVLEGYPFQRVLKMDNFLPLVDLFQNQSDIAKSLLAAFISNAADAAAGSVSGEASAVDATAASEPARDTFVIQTMFDCAKTLHDDVVSDAHAQRWAEEERREVCDMICRFIHKVDFGMDFERHLNFLVECRAYLPGFDAVKGNLVGAACALAMKTNRVVKGRHNKKTLAFVKACSAYCFITIPSMRDVFARMRLYTLASQVSLTNGLVAQAEACMRAAVATVPEVPAFIDDDVQIRPTDSELRAHLSVLVGALVTAPGHPEHGPYVLIHGLIKALSAYKWADGSTTKVRCMCDIIAMLCAQYQPRLPTHIPGVMSNDDLFGGDPEFQEETLQLIDKLLGEVVAAISELDNDPAGAKPQAEIALTLFNQVVSSAVITAKTAPLAVNLFKIARKSKQPKDARAIEATIEYLRVSSKDPNAPGLYAKLVKESKK